MIEFLTNNWKLIAILCAILVELVLLLVFKKRPQVVDNSFISKLCDWIKEAEYKYCQGVDKKCYVLDQAAKYLGENFSHKDVSWLIEYILSLPEKKNKENK